MITRGSLQTDLPSCQIRQGESSAQPSSDLLLLLAELLSETGVGTTENDLKTGLQSFTVAVTMNIIVHSKLLLDTYNPTHFATYPQSSNLPQLQLNLSRTH